MVRLNRRHWLLQPVPATFREPIKRPISDEQLLQAWQGIPTAEVRRRIDMHAPADGRATREYVRGIRLRLLGLREAGRG